MSAHRFREFAFASAAPQTTSRASSGFLPCPAPLLAGLSGAQQIFVHEIYRIARERAEAQLRPRRAVPEFSLN